MFLSTPFDDESTDLLDRLGVNAFKIDSGNLNHLQHLKYILLDLRLNTYFVICTVLKFSSVCYMSFVQPANNQLLSSFFLRV